MLAISLQATASTVTQTLSDQQSFPKQLCIGMCHSEDDFGNNRPVHIFPPNYVSKRHLSVTQSTVKAPVRKTTIRH